MSPRHFANIDKQPSIKLDPTVNYGPNLWYAFTTITGISKLFTYTPKEIANKMNKDNANGIQE